MTSYLQELFEGYYFCQAQKEDYFHRAKPRKEHPTILRYKISSQEFRKLVFTYRPIYFPILTWIQGGWVLSHVLFRMQKLAKELGVVIPVSFFEEANNAHYNSIVVIDADGTDLGLYRKSHIPDGPGLLSLIDSSKFVCPAKKGLFMSVYVFHRLPGKVLFQSRWHWF